jgi:hypothetical protein
MLTHTRYGTYIFFGLLTFGGAFFLWQFVPETMGSSLEEMDVLFGSVGFAARDREIMDEVSREVGLVDLAGHTDMTSHGIDRHEKGSVSKEEEADLSG